MDKETRTELVETLETAILAWRNGHYEIAAAREQEVRRECLRDVWERRGAGFMVDDAAADDVMAEVEELFKDLRGDIFAGLTTLSRVAVAA